LVVALVAVDTPSQPPHGRWDLAVSEVVVVAPASVGVVSVEAIVEALTAAVDEVDSEEDLAVAAGAASEEAILAREVAIEVRTASGLPTTHLPVPGPEVVVEVAVETETSLVGLNVVEVAHLMIDLVVAIATEVDTAIVTADAAVATWSPSDPEKMVGIAAVIGTTIDRVTTTTASVATMVEVTRIHENYAVTNRTVKSCLVVGLSLFPYLQSHRLLFLLPSSNQG
jgi:hypothetical protein